MKIENAAIEPPISATSTPQEMTIAKLKRKGFRVAIVMPVLNSENKLAKIVLMHARTRRNDSCIVTSDGRIV
jgi:hypothetical protein